jgi:hypothetical protein
MHSYAGYNGTGTFSVCGSMSTGVLTIIRLKCASREHLSSQFTASLALSLIWKRGSLAHELDYAAFVHVAACLSLPHNKHQQQVIAFLRPRRKNTSKINT